MPEAKLTSKLNQHGFSFWNWPGAGEAAAEELSLSHAVIRPANARTIIVGGQIGLKDDGSVPESIEDELREAFNHVKHSLQEAGLGNDAWEYVYKVNTFHAHTQDLPEFRPALNKIAREFFGSTRPAWVGVDIVGLFMPELHIEVSVEAFLP